MAWTTVTCNECGKDYEVQMYGKMRDRGWRVNNWTGYCDSCKQNFKDQLKKERKEQSEKDKKIAEGSGCVQLEGSEKQIQWAETLRIARIEMIKVLIGEALTEEKMDYAEWLKNKLEGTKKEKSATFFIDRRDNTKHNFKEGYANYLLKKKAEDFLST